MGRDNYGAEARDERLASYLYRECGHNYCSRCGGESTLQTTSRGDHYTCTRCGQPTGEGEAA